ncbi:MAG: hypothetical protein HeimC3_37700 [Candidatus Heimdallarchaeota archaeon LC_3]|nr:MAG: hypothetical protein HeimC3_50690 [Candidatus Heimdallarchaeota archaeon LC_3]OLS21021.1 MAG: hypothetical protein HeimC3_37700 [Candidatus Heimdallarchaeota archaeon LC_3]
MFDREGGLMIIKATSVEEAKEIAESDPFTLHGVQAYTLKPMMLSNKENNYLSPP